MSTEAISLWLQSPDTLPDDAAIGSMLQSWPWLMPARLMEAATELEKNGYSPRTVSLMQLYGTDWATTYRLVSGTGTTQDYTGHNVQPTATETGTAETDNVQPDAPRLAAAHPAAEQEPLILPLFTEDYFRHQGIETTPQEKQTGVAERGQAPAEDPKTLMVVMSFAEWLKHFKTKTEREREEERDKSALRSMWQQEKLAAALEDEPEEIPEDVFEMAVSSITREDDLASESLAEILEKQEKWAAAAEMYRKLSLRNPAKSAYFASRAEAAKKRLL